MGDVGDYWRDHKDYVRSLREFTCSKCGEVFASAYKGNPAKAKCQHCLYGDKRPLYKRASEIYQSATRLSWDESVEQAKRELAEAERGGKEDC